MKEYTILGEIIHKEKHYETMIDNDNKFFFLRINDKREYEYITLQELLELAEQFSYNKDVKLFLGKKDPNKKKMRLIPKIILGLTTIILSASLVGCVSNMAPKNTYKDNISYVQQMEMQDERSKTEIEIERILAKIEKENESFEIEKETQGWQLRIIYDSEALDDAIGYGKEEITYDDVLASLNSNPNISNKYKDLYKTLLNNLRAEYPNMDLRILYENMKTLKVVELSEMDMKIKAVSISACACYRIDENTIYTVKDYDYVPGTWEYQVIMHEMCHPMRSSTFTNSEGVEIRTQFESKSGSGTIVSEALNSLFALRSYDKNEKDIAYQLQSNMVEVMVDTLDNYTYQDYIEHNLTYFENALNEQNGNTEAMRMFGLIELQYKDYHKDEIDVPQQQFYELYDYIARMYYEKNIKPGMSHDEMLEVEKRLVEKITYDVPSEYNIDTDHFMEFFETYCAEKGYTDVRTK